jgi:hypothetical protein
MLSNQPSSSAVSRTLSAEQRNITAVQQCARNAHDQAGVRACLSSAGIDPNVLGQ